MRGVGSNETGLWSDFLSVALFHKGSSGWARKGFIAELAGTYRVTTVAATVPGPIGRAGGLNRGLV